MPSLTPAVYAQLLAQLALLALLGFSAHVLRQVWLPWTRSASRAARAVDGTVIFLALTVCVALVLSESASLNRGGALLACGAIATLCAWIRRRQRAPNSLSDGHVAPGDRRPLAATLAVAVFFGLPFALRALLVVPVDWDSLNYHLFFPATWIQREQVDLLAWAYPYNLVAFFPGNSELVTTMTMVVLRNDLLAQLVNLPLVAVTAIATGLLCRTLGGTRSAAWGAGLFVATTPALLSWGATSYVEPMLNVSVLAAVLYAVAALAAAPERLPRLALIAGLAAGLAAGTKYTGALPALCVGAAIGGAPLLWPHQAGRSRLRMAARAALLFTAAALLTASYWYLRNWVVTGNPVYPAPLLGLPSLDNPRQLPWDVTLLARFGELWRRGLLSRIWIGDPGQHMSLGFKAYLLAPMALVGLGWLLVSGVQQLRRGERATGAQRLFVLLAAMATLWTYLRLPYCGIEDWLFSNVRLVVPFICLAVAAGFALLGRLAVPTWAYVVLVAGALLLDGPFLDLSIPGLTPGLAAALSLATAAALAGAILAGGRLAALLATARRRWLAGTVGALALLCALVAALHHRERHRYAQLAWAREVHRSDHRAYAPAAAWLQRNAPDGKLAVTTSTNLQFLYLFVGPFLSREVLYVPIHDGPPGSHHDREGFNRRRRSGLAWLANLAAARAEYLLVMRYPDRGWPVEHRWARRVGFEQIYEDRACAIFRLQLPASRRPQKPKQGTSVSR